MAASLMIAIGLALYLSPRPLGRPASLASSTQIKLDRAKHAFEDGSYEEAIGLYHDILASDGSNREARDGLSLAESARTAEEEVFGKAGRSLDTKPTKVKAREMIEMVNDINAKFGDGKVHVTCWTCHQGSAKPEIARTPQ